MRVEIEQLGLHQARRNQAERVALALTGVHVSLTEHRLASGSPAAKDLQS